MRLQASLAALQLLCRFHEVFNGLGLRKVHLKNPTPNTRPETRIEIDFYQRLENDAVLSKPEQF